MATDRYKILTSEKNSVELPFYVELDYKALNEYFDNTVNKFVADNVQAAIEEACKVNAVTATANATTTSGTDALITGMTATPTVGTWYFSFDSSMISNNAGAIITYSIYLGGAQIAATIRTIAPFDGGTLSALNARGAAVVNAVVAVNGSQAVEVRWNTSGGTATCGARALHYRRATP